jgi:hypothetical protein
MTGKMERKRRRFALLQVFRRLNFDGCVGNDRRR